MEKSVKEGFPLFDYNGWDELCPYKQKKDGIYYKNKKILETPSYRNFYPFITKSGKWFAFYNQTYSDMKIINLETLEIVVDKFYRKEGKYSAHCNIETYVPGFLFVEMENNENYSLNDHSRYINKEKITQNNSKQYYFPFAFNGYTFWACDYEIYIDMFDISDIENGNISLLKQQWAILPIDLYRIRNYISAKKESWVSANEEEKFSLDFKVLQETYPEKFNRCWLDQNDSTDYSDLHDFRDKIEERKKK